MIKSIGNRLTIGEHNKLEKSFEKFECFIKEYGPGLLFCERFVRCETDLIDRIETFEKNGINVEAYRQRYESLSCELEAKESDYLENIKKDLKNKGIINGELMPKNYYEKSCKQSKYISKFYS